jgi:hypothetical protein
MADFYENIPVEQADQIEAISRLRFELRENHAALLKKYSARDIQQLKQGIEQGTIAEHPAYEDYLAAAITAQTQETLREELKAYLATLK